MSHILHCNHLKKKNLHIIPLIGNAILLDAAPKQASQLGAISTV